VELCGELRAHPARRGLRVCLQGAASALISRETAANMVARLLQPQKTSACAKVFMLTFKTSFRHVQSRHC
jgi:hypothetical protein